jgi:para-nitrobenzyl esterase
MSIVKIQNGRIEGSLDQGIHIFKGIPYAEPVGGRARWLPPVPRLPWQGVRDARRYGPACLQFSGGTPLPLPVSRRRYYEATNDAAQYAVGDDCLVLNVWTPSIDAGVRLPVMVYIHGGAFAAGAASGLYQASRFAAKGVVTVVIQYRLGAPGFLHGAGLFDGGFCADNRGFLDQICALQWVRDNIGCFGGDPANVTVFGESAGAFSVYQLIASPLAKGLFHRAIGMGGMAGTWAPAEDYHRLTRDALQQVGVQAGDADALAGLDQAALKRLQSALLKLVFNARDPDRYGRISRTFVPFLGAASGTALLPLPPLPCYRAGTPNNVDLMLGTCANDGGLLSLTLPLPPELNARLFSRCLRGLVPNRDMAAARDYYRKHLPDPPRGRVQEQVNNDAVYRMPTLRAAEAHAAAHPGRTWHYELACQSGIRSLGAIHGIDVALLFRTAPINRLLRSSAQTEALSEAMLEAWTAFARTGKPSAPSLPEWKPFEADRRFTMLLDDSSRLQADLDQPVRAFWAALGPDAA